MAELGGSAGGTVDGEPAVVVGNTLTVDVSSDYEVRLVWKSPDGTVTVFERDRGPDA